MKHKIFVSDSLAEQGVELLEKHFSVRVKTGLSEAELCKALEGFHGLVIRSATRVTPKLIAAAKSLKIVARAGVGVDNIDLDAATRAGIVVVNSPQGNTLAAAEHTLAMLMSMARNIPAADRSMREGKWERKAFTGAELFQKTVGVIGLGKIGAIVAQRAGALGMNVIAHDPFAGPDLAESLGLSLVSFNALIKNSDFITIHVPKSASTHHLIGAPQFKAMKTGVRIINCSRGGVIDEDALLRAIASKKVAQAALDVFEKEPLASDSPLLACKELILTPHLGASTQEAQINVAIDVAKQIRDFFNGVPPKSAVNIPSIKPEILDSHKPFFELAEKLGYFQAELLDGNVKEIIITYYGNTCKKETQLITRYCLVGFLKPKFQDSVNFVNAPLLTQARGVKLVEVHSENPSKFSDMISVEVVTDNRRRVASGTIFNGTDIRIVNVDGYWFDLIPKGSILFVTHKDRPGIIGKVGTLLGDRNINIAGMQVGRESARGNAVMALSVDDSITDKVIKELQKIEGLDTCKLLTF